MEALDHRLHQALRHELSEHQYTSTCIYTSYTYIYIYIYICIYVYVFVYEYHTYMHSPVHTPDCGLRSMIQLERKPTVGSCLWLLRNMGADEETRTATSADPATAPAANYRQQIPDTPGLQLSHVGTLV